LKRSRRKVTRSTPSARPFKSIETLQESDGDCPTCGKEMDKKHKKKEIKSGKNKIKKLKKQEKKLRKKLDKKDEKTRKIQD